MADIIVSGIDALTGETRQMQSGDKILNLSEPPLLVSSGTTSVNNDVDTLLHSIASPSSTKNYLFIVNFDPATDPTTDIEWGYYATNYSDGTGYGKYCHSKTNGGDLEFRVRFDQGGMSSAKNIKWSIYTVEL